MKYLWTEDTGAGLHFWKLVNQLFFNDALVVESKESNQGLLDALAEIDMKEDDKYYISFDYVVDNQDMWTECSQNYFTMDNIKIFMSRPTLFDILDDAKIRFNDSDIVIGGRGYNAWLKGWEESDFETVSNVAVGEIQQVIQQIILCMR